MGALAAPPEDRWLRDAPGYEQALQLQQELKVPLVIYFAADWCPYCRSLDGQYLTATPVQQYLRGVVKVRITPDHGRPERELAKQYGVTGYPTFLIIPKPSAGPRGVNPFRRGAPNLTPAEFAKVCANSPSSPAIDRRASPLKPSPSVATTNSETPVEEPPMPTVDSILKKYVDAIGGRDAQTKLSSRVSRGRVDIIGQSFGGRLEIYAKAPNKSLTVIDAEPIGTFKRGFDGRSGWNLSELGLQLTNGPELASLAADADFYHEIRLRELYPRMKVVERIKDGVRSLYKVEAIPRGGTPETLYFDMESGLLIRRDVPRKTSNGIAMAEFYFTDWRVVDGVRLPFKVTELLPNTKYVFTINKVEHNKVVEDAIFNKPLR